MGIKIFRKTVINYFMIKSKTTKWVFKKLVPILFYSIVYSLLSLPHQ